MSKWTQKTRTAIRLTIKAVQSFGGKLVARCKSLGLRLLLWVVFCVRAIAVVWLSSWAGITNTVAGVRIRLRTFLQKRFPFVWRVASRTTSLTVNRLVGGWSKAILALILASVAIAIHVAIIGFDPTLKRLVGEPMNEIAKILLYGLVPLLILSVLVWLWLLPFAYKDVKDRWRLNFCFSNNVMSLETRSIQIGATLVNRSCRNMSLKFNAALFGTDIHNIRWCFGVPAYWIPEGNSALEYISDNGHKSISVPSDTEINGGLYLHLPDEVDGHEWHGSKGHELIIMTTDSISGMTERFKALPGYPSGRIEELPRANKTIVKCDAGRVRFVMPGDGVGEIEEPPN